MSLLLVITPGADWAYAITAGCGTGRCSRRWAASSPGHLAATAVIAAGVVAVLARSPLVMATLTAAGAAYLVWLGVSTLAHPSVPQAGAEPADESWVRQAAKGAGISGLNPTTIQLRYICLLLVERRPATARQRTEYLLDVLHTCADPDRVARFWHVALPGYDFPHGPPDGYETWGEWADANDIPEDQRNAARTLVDRVAGRPTIFFNRVPESNVTKNRVHLDIKVGGSLSGDERRARIEAEAARLSEAGAGVDHLGAVGRSVDAAVLWLRRRPDRAGPGHK